MSSFILASGSAARAQVLRAAGLDPVIVKPNVDEEELKLTLRAGGATPRDQADALAEVKAVRVSARHPGALVLSGDQVLDLNGEAFDKPQSHEEARAQLLRLRGMKHSLFSAAVIALDGEPIWRHIGRAQLTMRRFSEPFLDRYLDDIGDGVFETVGGYKLEEQGAQLFSRIDGDLFTILGMPLLELLAYLRVRGVMPQ